MASTNTYIVVDKAILDEEPSYFPDTLDIEIVETDSSARRSIDGTKYFVKTGHPLDVDEVTLPAGTSVVAHAALLTTLGGDDWTPEVP